MLIVNDYFQSTVLILLTADYICMKYREKLQFVVFKKGFRVNHILSKRVSNLDIEV